MKKSVYVMSLFAAVAMTACMTTAPEPEAEGRSDQAITTLSQAVARASELPQLPEVMLARGSAPPVHANSVTCENHYGSCRISNCEEPREWVQNLSVVCCEDGSCWVENYFICGCD